MGFRYRPPPGWPWNAPQSGFGPAAGWLGVPQAWNHWLQQPHLVAVGMGLDVAVFLTVWLVTLGFAQLDLTMYGAKTTAAWFWLWIAGAGMGLTGVIVAASPERRSFGLGLLLGLPLPVLLAPFLTA